MMHGGESWGGGGERVDMLGILISTAFVDFFKKKYQYGCSVDELMHWMPC